DRAGPRGCQRFADAFAHLLERSSLCVHASDAVNSSDPPSRLVAFDGRHVLLRPLRHSLSSNPLGSTQPLSPQTRLEITLDRAKKSRSEVLAGVKRDRREAPVAMHPQMRAGLSHLNAPKRAQDPSQCARI